MKFLDILIVFGQAILIVPTICFIGAIPIIRLSSFSFIFSAGLGFAIVSALAWLSLETAVHISHLLNGCFAFLALLSLFQWRMVVAAAKTVPIEVIYFFLGYAFVLATLHILPTLPTDFRFTSIGNNDTFMYMKAADYLLGGSGTGNIASFDWAQYIKADVVGAFGYVALAAHILHVSTVDAAHPAIISIVAATATCAAIFVRRAMRVPSLAAFAVGGVAILTPFAIYFFYAFFLSQAIFNMLLLALVLRTLGDPLSRAGIVGASLLVSFDVLFIYPAMWPAFAATYVALLFLLAIIQNWTNPTKIAVSHVTFAAIAVLLASAVVAFIAHERLQVVLHLISVANAGTAGWPLGFLNPAAFYGIPFKWDVALTLSNPTIQVELAATIVVILALAAIAYLRKQPLSVICIVISAGCLAAYLLLWLHDGAFYRPWKFAASYTSLFAFFVVGAFFSLIARHRITLSTMTAALYLCLTVNVFAMMTWANALNVHFDQLGFRRLGKLDTDTSMLPVDIDLPSMPDRMFAMNFIKKRTIKFVGPTYFGSGSPATIGETVIKLLPAN